MTRTGSRHRVVACALALGACQATLFEYRETREPACEEAGVPRECACPDGRRGMAECYGPDDSGPCDCVGEPPGGGVAHVAVGGAHACAVLDDGRVACWGENRHGQLGDGLRVASASPVEVTQLDDAVALALGGGDESGHTCALRGDGTVACWGLDDQGQLGDGRVEAQDEPVALGLDAVREVAAGTLHTCAADADGLAWCWGWDDALGRERPALPAAMGSVPERVEGLAGVTGLALGHEHTCAVLRDGEAVCWGAGGEGRLGDGTSEARATPTPVTGLPEVSALVAGYAHTCALAQDASVWCWGENDRGQLGDGGETTMRATPARVRELPGAVELAAGWKHTCARLADRSVRCWGDNDHGQLGDGTRERKPVPTAIEGLEGVVEVAAGVYTSCARTDDDGLSCWGDNHAGQLGDGTTQDRDIPVAVRWQLADVADSADAGAE